MIYFFVDRAPNFPLAFLVQNLPLWMFFMLVVLLMGGYNDDDGGDGNVDDDERRSVRRKTSTQDLSVRRPLLTKLLACSNLMFPLC